MTSLSEPFSLTLTSDAMICRNKTCQTVTEDIVWSDSSLYEEGDTLETSLPKDSSETSFATAFDNPSAAVKLQC